MVLQNINKNLFLLPLWSISLFQSELQLCLLLQMRLDTFFLPSLLSSTTHECHHFTLVAAFLINIATCCEGHRIKILTNNNPFFRVCGCFSMSLLSQFSHNHVTAGKYSPPSPAVQTCFDCTSCARHYTRRLRHTFFYVSSKHTSVAGCQKMYLTLM